jgi:ATP-dependent DNA helicase RecG
MSPAAPPTLDQPVQFLKGVGPRRAESLARLGVRTARDLLFHVPRRYEDASTVTRISDVRTGEDVTIIGRIASKGVIPTRSGLRIFQVILQDDSGRIEASWPGQPFLDRSLGKGDLLLVTGPVRFFHGRQIQPREHIVIGRADEPAEAAGRVLPIYPTTEGLSQRMLRAILDQNLDPLLALLAPEEIFPQPLLAELRLPSLMQAVSIMHRPAALADAERGRQRLAFEELFILQLLHARARRQFTAERPGTAFTRTDEIIAPLFHALPFRLTDAQARALRSIYADMMSPRRMNRLLQGDVGSGKTVVALFAMALAAESRYQSALMAPTEILAEQHARTLAQLTHGLPITITLLTGRLGAAERRVAYAAIASGEAMIAVGTHALIQQGVQFHRLGLAIVDEQHRFGVRQRMALAQPEGDAGATRPAPDTLVMTATPIPRSLALTLYGDLDLTVLDERPPGRVPIRTRIATDNTRNDVHDFVRAQVREGRQAYIVYPLVEESEKIDLPAAVEAYEHLAGSVFPDMRVGLLHGQLAGDTKDATMRAFAEHRVDILVATTVIEVGIDVPNATVMVIEHAERFGLSQLHQLRGRVGRGAAESHCILVSPAGEASRRLDALVRTDDGFEIARFDLRLRGMGDFFGARQHGIPEFRFFDPETDEPLLLAAREHATDVIARDPDLDMPAHSAYAEALRTRYANRALLYEVG